MSFSLSFHPFLVFYLSTYFILTILMPVWLGWRCMY